MLGSGRLGVRRSFSVSEAGTKGFRLHAGAPMYRRPLLAAGDGPSARAEEAEVCHASARVVCLLGRLEGAAGGAGVEEEGASGGRLAFEVAARVRAAGLSLVDI
jgi:hypothetical protein